VEALRILVSIHGLNKLEIGLLTRATSMPVLFSRLMNQAEAASVVSETGKHTIVKAKSAAFILQDITKSCNKNPQKKKNSNLRSTIYI
jgi:hypothetical protein